MTHRGIILGESVFSTLKYEYLGENETKNENILTRWSDTQAGSNFEKNGGPKSRWTVPLRISSLYKNRAIYSI